jgi:hypothetical protein
MLADGFVHRYGGYHAPPARLLMVVLPRHLIEQRDCGT